MTNKAHHAAAHDTSQSQEGATLPFQPGDKVRCINEVGALEDGNTYRVAAVDHATGNIYLHGEPGAWTPENFAIAQFAKNQPGPAWPSASDQAEANSVTISLDHVSDGPRPGGEHVVNLQLSTNDAHHVLLNQVAYFRESDGAEDILKDPANIAAIAAGFGAKVFYSYRPSERMTNLIMDTEVFGHYCDEAGSLMGGVAAAVQEATIMHENFARAGKDTTLMVFVPDLSDEVKD